MATNFPTYPSTTFEQAVELAIFSANQLHNVINGDATSTVESEDGDIPSLRYALVNNFYFRSPIAWSEGNTAVVFNQLYYFTSLNDRVSGLYYAPSATATNPITLGSSPIGDPNFVLYTATANIKPLPFTKDKEISAYGRIYYKTNDRGIDSSYAYIGTAIPYVTTADSPESDQSGVWSASNPTGIWLKLGEANSYDLFSAKDGEKYIGSAANIADLRTIEPTIQGQRVWLREYASNTGRGQGYFIYNANDTTSVDDAGYIVVTAGGKRWKRDLEPEQLLVTHYGAIMDGTTDDMPACKRMYTGTRNLGSANAIGIRLPAGKIALRSTFNESGSTEQPIFSIKGPAVDYGVNPKVQVYFLDKTSTTPVFQVNARRTEITGLHLQGAGTVTPFYKNVCPAGQYYRVKNIRCNSTGGMVFELLDTIDTAFEQIYCYSITGGFLRAGWTNTKTGAWDHSTAIEISNSNFSSGKNIEAITAIRAGQCIMRNTWFSNNEYTFDISQGGWLFDTVIMENSTYPGKTKYSKIVQINCRFAQGATMDDTLSGYTKDMDLVNGGSGNIPSWVGNSYDQGKVRINLLGSYFDGPLAARFTYTEQYLDNGNSAATWFDLGKITLQGLGRTAHIKVTGMRGWDSVSDGPKVPAHTAFGGGEANIYYELKYPNSSGTTAGQLHWHGTDGCPVTAVKYVHTWQSIQLYVQLAPYALHASVFMTLNGTVRIATGNPAYTVWSGAEISEAEVNAKTNITTAPARWSINKGDYNSHGFGMDIDAGMLQYHGATTAEAAATSMPIYINGAQYNIPLNPLTSSMRIPRYTVDTMPSPSANVYGIVLCTNTILSPAAQLMYSDGTRWFATSGNANWKTA